LLGLGRDLARALGVERVAALNRIDGGVAFRAPGVALVLCDDRIRLIQWTRSPGELRIVQDHVTRRLGALPIEDMRMVEARRTAGRAGKPPGPQEPEVGRIDPAEPDRPREPEAEDATPTASADDDFGPGF
jgi:hypothetical protein